MFILHASAIIVHFSWFPLYCSLFIVFSTRHFQTKPAAITSTGTIRTLYRAYCSIDDVSQSLCLRPGGLRQRMHRAAIHTTTTPARWRPRGIDQHRQSSSFAFDRCFVSAMFHASIHLKESATAAQTEAQVRSRRIILCWY